MFNYLPRALKLFCVYNFCTRWQLQESINSGKILITVETLINIAVLLYAWWFKSNDANFGRGLGNDENLGEIKNRIIRDF